MTASVELSDEEKRALPCFQNPGPWQDDDSKGAREWAQRQCVTRCTQRAWCEQERLSVVSEFGKATGVWAGVIWRERTNRTHPSGVSSTSRGSAT